MRGQKQGNGKKAEIVVRREETTEDIAHGGSWKIAYADFVTAMMAFFLLMWLINATTEAQRRGLADYFAPSNVFSLHYSGSGKPFGGRTPFSDGRMVSDNGAVQVITGTAEPEPNAKPDPNSRNPGTVPPERARVPPIHPGPATIAAIATPVAANPIPTPGGPADQKKGEAGPDIGAPALPLAFDRTAAAQEQASFARAAAEVRAAIRQDPALAGLADQIAIDVTAQGLRIQIMDTRHRPMFALGSAALTRPAQMFVALLAPILTRLAGPIEISGYTDAAPYHGNGTSNWDLSAERANTARALLVADGLPEGRIARVAGYADRDLLLPADPLAAANRRITILVTGVKKAAPPRATVVPQ
ncbi:MAG TPA: flagellar motor protein MotB [Acetobacteraceae bacterium]|nr:flagellar motor protein MotB [Acetobacteraceae bacterium]